MNVLAKAAFGGFLGIGFMYMFSVAAVGEIRYELTDLGARNGADSRALGINDSGMVVGWANEYGENNRAYLSHPASNQIQYIHHTGVTSAAYSINSSGISVGHTVFDSGEIRATRWNTVTGQQEFIGPSNVQSKAFSVSEQGFVAGQFLSNDGWHAFRFQDSNNNSDFQDLGTLGGSSSTALSVNRAGTVVGYSLVTPTDSNNWIERGFVWSPDTGMRDLGTLGGLHSRAHNISDQGDIVGQAWQTNEQPTAFISLSSGARDYGPMINLGVLGDFSSCALDSNESRSIVGWYSTNETNSSDRRACLYNALSDTSIFQRIDLTDSIDPANGWRLVEATAINESGWIVGYGIDPYGIDRGFLLTPIPSPGCIIPLIVLAASRILHRKRN